MRLVQSETSGRRGFSFIEVLFAVMILGVGFIMLAGILPLSIRQVEESTDETIAASVARGAFATLSAGLPWAELPSSDGAMVSLRQLSPAAWRKVSGQVISTADPRYGWVPLVKFAGMNDPAVVTVLVVRSRDGRPLGPTDLVSADPSKGTPSNLEPRAVTVTLADGGRNPDTLTFEPTEDPDADPTGGAAPGSFVVIASDQGSGGQNGQAYRLANPRDASRLTWDLMPGNDLARKDQEVFAARAYVVGRPAGDSAVVCVGLFTTIVMRGSKWSLSYAQAQFSPDGAADNSPGRKPWVFRCKTQKPRRSDGSDAG